MYQAQQPYRHGATALTDRLTRASTRSKERGGRPRRRGARGRATVVSLSIGEERTSPLSFDLPSSRSTATWRRSGKPAHGYGGLCPPPRGESRLVGVERARGAA